jgi:lipoteichoic acid synthase
MSFIKLDVLLKSFDVLYFSDNILNIIKKHLIELLIIILPFLIVNYFIYKNNYKVKFNYKSFIIVLLLYFIHISTIILFDSDDIYSKNNLYFNINFPSKNLSSFGLLTSIRLDMQRYIFGFNDKGSSVSINNNTYSNSEYNVLDINFKDSDNDNIKEINDYINSVIPTKKNIYTGLFKDKNLIFILAESFNTIAVSEELTPNLYRLFCDGFTFDNFYNPLYPVSTADGQYLSDISLFPSDMVHSLENCNENYYPYSLGNVFSKLNYNTYSYHNYKYDYYSRDKYYKNMGFKVYKGIGNGLDMDDSRSDYDLVKSSINEFINDEKFMTYYLTISGHAPYNKNNKIAMKNIELLNNYDYSDSVKYYLSTQIELDNMIGLLFDELEKYNKLDDTVIVLIPDHVPYGLTIDEMNEISDIERDNEFEKYRSSLVIYNEDINKYKSNDNYCSNIDILPTLLNLFGVEYDSRLLMGRDILSNNDGIIVFGNRNIVTKDYKYSNMNDYYIGNVSKEEIDDLKNNIYIKYRISRLMLENDYYKYLFNS